MTRKREARRSLKIVLVAAIILVAAETLALWAL
jgi:hypothetical protein